MLTAITLFAAILLFFFAIYCAAITGSFLQEEEQDAAKVGIAITLTAALAAFLLVAIAIARFAS